MAIYGSLFNSLMDAPRPTAPEVGMGATVLMWSDRVAGTVIEVSADGKRIKVQDDRSLRTDGLGMTDAQSYRYERNPDGAVTEYSLRKNGRWVRAGDSMNGQGLALGTRRTYFDYGF